MAEKIAKRPLAKSTFTLIRILTTRTKDLNGKVKTIKVLEENREKSFMALDF